MVNGDLVSSSSPPWIAFCLLPTLLHLSQAGWRGLLARMAALDKMSPPTGKGMSSNFKNGTNYAGMSMKTKGRLNKGSGKAGIS
jgi:hypothetical protein